MYFCMRFGRKSQWYPLAIFRENVNSENLGNDWCVSVKAPAQGGSPGGDQRSRTRSVRRRSLRDQALTELRCSTDKPSQICQTQSNTVKDSQNLVKNGHCHACLPLAAYSPPLATRHRSVACAGHFVFYICAPRPSVDRSQNAQRPVKDSQNTVEYQSNTVKNPIVQNCCVLIY